MRMRCAPTLLLNHMGPLAGRPDHAPLGDGLGQWMEGSCIISPLRSPRGLRKASDPLADFQPIGEKR
jgi:hypothetical protein